MVNKQGLKNNDAAIALEDSGPDDYAASFHSHHDEASVEVQEVSSIKKSSSFSSADKSFMTEASYTSNSKRESQTPVRPHGGVSPVQAVRGTTTSAAKGQFPRTPSPLESLLWITDHTSTGISGDALDDFHASPHPQNSPLQTPQPSQRRRDTPRVATTQLTHSPIQPFIPPPTFEYHDTASFSSSDRMSSRPSTKKPRSHYTLPRSKSAQSGFAYSTASSQPYASVNPYQASISYSLGHDSTHALHVPASASGNDTQPATSAYLLAFIFDTIPRQIYLHLLLRLPSLYFSRVARIFEDADLTLPEIARLAHVTAPEERKGTVGISGFPVIPNAPPFQYAILKTTWETFIDSLLREWKTLNLVSVLLLSAILTMLQLSRAIDEPLILYSALASLLCSLMSLLYGCMYIIRFGSMRKTYRAVAWAEAAQKTKTVIWWNVWVLLAMPAVWLTWAIILFVTCIMTYVWLIDPSAQHTHQLTTSRLPARIIISSLLTISLTYVVLIALTFQEYGETLDKKWSQNVFIKSRPSSLLNRGDYSPTAWSSPMKLESVAFSAQSENGTAEESPHVRSQGYSPVVIPVQPPIPPPGRGRGSLDYGSDSSGPRIPRPPSLFQAHLTSEVHDMHTRRSTQLVPRTVPRYKIVDLRFQDHSEFPLPASFKQRGLQEQDWQCLVSELCLAWDTHAALRDSREPEFLRSSRAGLTRPQDAIKEVLLQWNQGLENQNGLQAVLCKEYSDDFPESPTWAVYILDYTTDDSGDVPRLAERFGAVPEGLWKVIIFDPPDAPVGSGAPDKAAGTTTIARRVLGGHVRFRKVPETQSSGGVGHTSTPSTQT
ncbi:hypothetical protein AX17_002263 [Amanita inopinata Kibby_2008]|nr:hypothetical protein AX17_002263 [Amanita inopinata Kibby_2008]